jgi:O-antigen/teichoic acid export membrane protein
MSLMSLMSLPLPAEIEKRPGARQVSTIEDLGRLAVRGSIWTVVGFGLGQVLRLASNLILTRLLFPEVFGLMALVTVFIQGLQLFSDFGVRGSVVNHERGDDPVFLNTVWTLRIVRGVCLWLCLCLLAPPLSAFYGEPAIRTLIPLVAFGSVMDGFVSTSVFTLQRHVEAGKLAALDLGTQVFSTALMIAWAWLSPSIWALVGGTLGGTLLNVLISHLMIPGYRNRIAWEKEAARALFRYGRWIFFATALTFIASHVDRAVLGKFVSMSQLGVYSIAVMLSQFLVQVSQQLGQRILFPVYAKLARRNDGDLRRRTLQIRVVLLACLLPPLWFLILWGRQVVGFLYDPRYADAGWMLQILAVGATITLTIESAQTVLLAQGDSFRHMLVQLVQATAFLGVSGVGGTLGGVPGFLVGIAASRIVAYPALCLCIRRYGVWLPKLDVTSFALSGGIVALAVYFG